MIQSPCFWKIQRVDFYSWCLRWPFPLYKNTEAFPKNLVPLQFSLPLNSCMLTPEAKNSLPPQKTTWLWHGWSGDASKFGIDPPKSLHKTSFKTASLFSSDHFGTLAGYDHDSSVILPHKTGNHRPPQSAPLSTFRLGSGQHFIQVQGSRNPNVARWLVMEKLVVL